MRAILLRIAIALLAVPAAVFWRAAAARARLVTALANLEGAA